MIPFQVHLSFFLQLFILFFSHFYLFSTGIAKSPSSYSAFHDEEFVIFNPSQQRQEYLIEFKVHDKPLPSPLVASGAVRTPNTVSEYKMGDPTCLLAEHPNFSSASSSSSSGGYSTTAYAMPKPKVSTSGDLFSVVNVDSLAPQTSSPALEVNSPSASSSAAFSVPSSPQFSVPSSSPSFTSATTASPSFSVSAAPSPSLPSSSPSPFDLVSASPSASSDPFAWEDHHDVTESPSEALRASCMIFFSFFLFFFFPLSLSFPFSLLIQNSGN